ncbi:MAG: acetylglutamate kinase [Actinomycetota bacterium]
MIVLKVGGASVGRIELPDEPCVVVHGAGPQISQEMAARGIEPEFVNGRRVTTPEVLEIVMESFAQVNAALCAAIGERAVGLNGAEIGLAARQVPELGLVGDPLPSAPAPVIGALAAGLVPVVSPLARGPLNVNADEMASALAVGLGATRISFVTDVPGVFHEGELIQTIEAAHAESLVEGGVFDGGIVPKLLAAALAAKNGVAADIGVTAVVA